jgi:DNA-binding transcriptional LysR family regulator
VATHSNVHALSASSRNLTDRQLGAIAESGGVVGLNYAVGFLREDGRKRGGHAADDDDAASRRMVEHLGEGGVALGSDFDGALVPAEIGDAAGLPALVGAMRQAGSARPGARASAATTGWMCCGVHGACKLGVAVDRTSNWTVAPNTFDDLWNCVVRNCGCTCAHRLELCLLDRLTEMEAFVRVVELGGFTDAARKLGVSKSAVSKHVSALEARLGARLLNRTTRRVNPTEIGLAYYDRVTRVLADAREADSMAASMQGTPQGELRISAPLSFGLRHLGPAVTDFLNAYPDVAARVSLDDRFVELVAEGFDLAIRIGSLPDSTLIARKLSETAIVMVASPDYLRRMGAPKGLEALGDHQLLHYANLASGQSWRLRAPSGEERQVRAVGRLTVNNGDALLQAACNGLGIALSPAFICAEALRSGDVVEVLPGARPEPLGVWAVYPAGRFPQPKLRVFVDFLAERFKASGPDW